MHKPWVPSPALDDDDDDDGDDDDDDDDIQYKNHSLGARLIFCFLCQALYILLLLYNTLYYKSLFTYYHGVYLCLNA